ncbi:MAG TPA: nucleotide sugar dehydrogenase [Methanoregula sp.]|nr:nucleotide sugar dehydrogenase [Methanoregula sp.]
MEESPVTRKTVCIVGLGYVGLPLAEAFSHRVRTLGFDIDARKVQKIKKTQTAVQATSDPTKIREADFVMICVPTLLTPANDPDLSYVRNAAAIVGANMKKGAVVILESTVYPGVTEEVLLPVLENESGLRAGRDFRVGYSPERINPGDDEHVLARTTKIVAGMDRETGDAMAELYSLITRVYRAPDIRTAEAAKVVENIQRDINIALINEFSQMFARMHLNTRDVLDAAATKWNFHPYTPGIVGGHCIPTVPYFLAYAAKRVGYTPRMILAGRATNDFMTKFVADLVISNLKSAGRTAAGSKIAILGLTYKENVPDFRDNPVTDIIRYLGEQGVAVFGYDPLLSPEEIAGMGVAVLPDLARQMDGYILAAPHAQFLEMRREFSAIADPAILFIDIKGVFHRDEQMKKLFNYITL